MLKHIALFCLFVFSVPLFAAKANHLGILDEETEEQPIQVEEAPIPTLKNPFSSLWATTRTLQTPFYRVLIPSVWEKFPNMSSGVEQNYSIKNLPNSFNNSVVLVTFLVTRQAGSSLNETVRLVKAGLTRNATVKDYNFSANNWEGVVVESFQPQLFNGRDSKRYDLVLYSPKKQAFTFSFIVLLKDANNEFAKKFDLDSYVEQIFNHIWLNE